MYAVMETGGKQLRVQKGDIVEIEKLDGDVGSKISFDKVLFCSQPQEGQSEVFIGQPYLNGAAVTGEILAQGRGDKVRIVKMKRRKQYRRTQGHRQFQTQILVTSVSNGSGIQEALSDTEKKATLSTFFTNLKPKGPKRTQKKITARTTKKPAVKAAKKN
jgi:large subunit ribosomal protein L21